MEALKLARFLDEAGDALHLESGDVYDKASKKSLAQHLVELSSLREALDAFLSGEADGGAMDRLKELVAAIHANKDSIDALVADHVTKDDIINDLVTGGTDKVLSAEQGKALKALLDALQGTAHSHANKETLDMLGKTEDNVLTCNGREVYGGGIALVSSPEEQPASWNGKIRIMVEAFDPAAGA